MVPPHGLQKLKAAPYQFLRVRFTRFILPVNGMCTKCVHDRHSDCIAPRRNHYQRHPPYSLHHRMGHRGSVRYIILSFDREELLVFVNRKCYSTKTPAALSSFRLGYHIPSLSARRVCIANFGSIPLSNKYSKSEKTSA